jgi:hypothetical protein
MWRRSIGSITAASVADGGDNARRLYGEADEREEETGGSDKEGGEHWTSLRRSRKWLFPRCLMLAEGLTLDKITED